MFIARRFYVTLLYSRVYYAMHRVCPSVCIYVPQTQLQNFAEMHNGFQIYYKS